MSSGLVARIAVGGVATQLLYGAIAVAVGYPKIIDVAAFEILWGVACVGMAAALLAWVLSGAAGPSNFAVIGAGLGVAGFLLRIGVVVVLTSDQGSAVDMTIVASILLMLGGLLVLGIATVRAAAVDGVERYVPLIVLGAGVITSSLYSPAPSLHFPFLGLFWGPTWLLMAVTAAKRVRAVAAR